MTTTTDSLPFNNGLPVVVDPQMRAIFDSLERLAGVGIPILLLGESGSGKEVLSEWIHHNSGRADRGLVRVNCAGLTESVVESELFGHEKGAFTGAVQAHAGIFETADGGSLFLDEIAELPARTQAKLLRVLESGEYVRVGGRRARRADVRWIAATHRDLRRLVKQGEFRQDLYYRLNGATVEIPPLRQRRCEIVPLAMLFLKQCAALWKRPDFELAEDAVAALLSHSWPGNVRELRHVIERAAATCTDRVLRSDTLTFDRISAPSVALVGTDRQVPEMERGSSVGDGANPGTIRTELREFERGRILEALRLTKGNQTQAAKMLGVSRRTLYNKLAVHGVERSRRGLISSGK